MPRQEVPPEYQRIAFAFTFTLWDHTPRRLAAIESSFNNSTKTMLVQIAVLAGVFLGERIGIREALGLVER